MQLKWLQAGVLAGLVLLSGSLWLKEPRVRHGDSRLHSSGDRLYFNNKPFSGFEEEYFDNGDLYRENHFVDGRLEGVSRQYSLGGKLREVQRYRGGKKEGLQEGWFAEGPKRFEFQFRSGLLDGEQMEWHLNGEVFRRRVYEMGLETQKKILYPHAEIFTNYVVRNGRQYGLDGGALCLEVKAEGSR